MRRRKAILLFGAIFLSLAAYCSWCARPFYLKPPLRFHGTIGEDYRRLVLSWQSTTGGFGPERFTLGDFAGRLMHPYDSAPIPAYAQDQGGVIIVSHPRKAYIVRITSATESGWCCH